jgi:Cu(I)/Ag(I) efflux system membrane fusion protein
MRKASKTFTAIAALACVLSILLTMPIHAEAGTSEDLTTALKPYEQIRVQLLNDTLDGVAVAANELHKVAVEKKKTLGGAHAKHSEESHKLSVILDEIAAGTETIQKAAGIEGARDGFYEVSKALVRYRNLVNGEDGVVAYCPMVKRSWIQPEGELGNPYKGQTMPTCGEVVDD